MISQHQHWVNYTQLIFYYIILHLNGLKLNTSTAHNNQSCFSHHKRVSAGSPTAANGKIWAPMDWVFGMVDTLPEAKPTVSNTKHTLLASQVFLSYHTLASQIRVTDIIVNWKLVGLAFGIQNDVTAGSQTGQARNVNNNFAWTQYGWTHEKLQWREANNLRIQKYMKRGRQWLPATFTGILFVIAD